MTIKLIEKLKDRARRRLFVAGQIKTGIPFQIRALRDKYGWTQADLGERLGMTQTNISRLESPGYGKLNITTLQRLAAAFDVALIVRFVPFSQLINWVDNLSPEEMAPQNFTEELDGLENMATMTRIKTGIVGAGIVTTWVKALDQTPLRYLSVRFPAVPVQIVNSMDITEEAAMQTIAYVNDETEDYESTPILPSTMLDYTSSSLPF